MNNSQIPIRYAAALFSLAVEMDVVVNIEKDMRSLQLISANSEDFRVVLRSPVIKPHLKKKILHEIFANTFHQLTMRFLTLVTQQGRERFIAEMTREFLLLCRKRDGVVDVSLTSAYPLGQSIIGEIETKIANLTGLKPVTEQKLDPRLLGGFMVRFGDTMYDASVKNKISKIRRDFQSNMYEKGF